MLPALYVSKTGLAAQDINLTTISNNLANVSTTGFKRDRAEFQDLLYQIKRQPGAQSTQDSSLPSGLQLGTGVRIVGTQKNFSAGSLQTTDQPLDLAINGRGFFQIRQPSGTVAYTRDGSFHLDTNGQIVTANGFALEPAIVVPQQAQTFTVGQDGTVSITLAGATATPQIIGNVQTADFINPAGLQSQGGNLFLETASSGAPQVGTPGLNGFGTTQQNTLEASNVSTVEEMVNMITTQRAYEMNSKVISTADQMLQHIAQNL
ncbi:flagellar basal-body rod protein FlgG [Pseudomonas sp. 10B1]|uniref:flagellar basal-body rod protein FlgG n=1 Tax=unclassified Pseudomonas TaxID=196821 RepID=UPI002AB38B78|nr:MULTISPECIES: flagellar basal-body rod protein FlgG [unclassified Pseudomonas]MDY7560773.1 flagellar basal-body rod protein FlgG [Pseudomonas sp. AB6]MEA9997122.1 flagellar basal-body rod protein FlgG [Pseudomonas sp. AA4]MEB0087311.1 flagellar basal-body rod protein FlgG [Pseudomonas sp. RTI1]MEB0128098.1 flagellar basal-body rod protein FlgG [Pseudomonas sp. CCC1.2]MEB0154581.1 flagellar basal-body rod protein FlgG [Pseudomonas sp. CCC4.3]